VNTATATPEPAPPPACLNCGEPLLPPPGRPAPSWCPACGQETVVLPPTLREMAQQFGGAYLSTEGALWRTLKLLLSKPGELTRQYLEGRRKHYVLPLRLYLTISLVALLLMRLASSGEVRIDAPELTAGGGRLPDVVVLGFGDGRGAGLRNGTFYCDHLPGWFCKRLQRRLDIDPKAVGRELEQFKDRFVGNLGTSMLLLVPGFALALKLVYWNRRRRYTEHLVFALHVHALWFLVLAVASPLKWLVFGAMLAVPWYTLAAMKRVYGGRWWARWLRAGMVVTLYGIALGLAITGVLLWTLLS